MYRRLIATRTLALLVAILLAAGAAALAHTPAARGGGGLHIQFVYDESGDGVDPCDDAQPTCGHTDALALTLAVAGFYWENIIQNDHTVVMRYQWYDEALPEAQILETDANGRPTEVFLRFPASTNYYYDPNPLDDDEFDMRTRLYRTVHPVEQAEAFQGDTPPEVLEVSYTGLRINNSSTPDLLTIALHEIGHGLGLANAVHDHRPAPACTEDHPWFHIDPALVGGASFEVRAYNGTDCQHVDIGGIQACKTFEGQDALSTEESTLPPLTVQECTSHQSLYWQGAYPRSRMYPSVTDILLVAESAGWTVDLPRKYTLTGGIWHDPDFWLGQRVPDADSDAYLVNEEGGPIEVNVYDAGGRARDLHITSGNALNVFFNDFTVDTAHLEGEGTRLTADTSAVVFARETEVGPGAILDVPFGGSVNSTHIRNAGEVRGADSSIYTWLLSNTGLIRGNGGLLSFFPDRRGGAFDLDGPSGYDARLEATVGDLAFNGPITDPVIAGVEVGPGRFIRFTHGWSHGASGSLSHALRMTGAGKAVATIEGDTKLASILLVDQIARFTDDLQLDPIAQVHLTVGGLEAGPDHDQVRIDGHATLNGLLKVELADGYKPAPGDRFSLMTWDTRAGQFSSTFLPDLGPKLTLVLDYQPDRLDLVVLANRLRR